MAIPTALNNTAGVGEGRVSQSAKAPAAKIVRASDPGGEASAIVDIIDIRHNAVEINLKDAILRSLRSPHGPKTMPTLLLYDDRGLQLFEEVIIANCREID